MVKLIFFSFSAIVKKDYINSYSLLAEYVIFLCNFTFIMFQMIDRPTEMFSVVVFFIFCDFAFVGD